MRFEDAITAALVVRALCRQISGGVLRRRCGRVGQPAGRASQGTRKARGALLRLMLDHGQQLVLQQILEPLPLGEAHLWRNPAVAPSRMCARVCFRPSLRSVNSHPQQEPAPHRRTSHARPASPFSSASYLAPRPSVRPERESAQRRGRMVCAHAKCFSVGASHLLCVCSAATLATLANLSPTLRQ